MKFLKFRIRNFKGIQNAEIRFGKAGEARVYTLVGLNESGKTTLLEAIHSFSPDSDTEIVVGNVTTIEQQRQQRVPRHHISDFTGKVLVQATVVFDDGDIDILSRNLAQKGFTLDSSKLTTEFTFEHYQQYKNGDHSGSFFESSLEYLVKTKGQRKFRKMTNDESSDFYSAIMSIMPAIAYFPTFVFDFPEKIFLSNRNSDKVNAFYRNLFQDIMSYSGRGHTIQEHIISRIRKPEFKTGWAKFFAEFSRSNENKLFVFFPSRPKLSK